MQLTEESEPVRALWHEDEHHHSGTCYWDMAECRWSCQAPRPAHTGAEA